MSGHETTTEAYVARPDHVLALEQVTYAAPGRDEVLVDIVAAGVCHSDLKAAAGTFHLKPPLILGHEGAGYVRDIGPGVSLVAPGDAVVLAYASCGACRRCVAGNAAYCDELFGLNFTGKRTEGGEGVVRDARGREVAGLFFGQSSMSRIALVRERCCVRVTPLLREGREGREELRRFACLGCGVQTGAGSILNVAKPEEGSSIAIFGGGAVGLAALMAAKTTKPGVLILIDNSDAKLAMIPKELLEGVRVVNSSTLNQLELVTKLKQLTPHGRGLDVALDCVGNETVVNTAYEALGKMAMLLNIGGNPTAKPHFNIERNLVNGLTIRGTHQGDSVSREMIPRLIQMWRDGQFPFDKLLTKFRFEELDRAIEEVHKGNVIKPLLVT